MAQPPTAADPGASRASPAWEIAFAHAVLANAGAAANEPDLHREHYEEARALGEALADAEERAIFAATFRRVPVPSR